MSQQPARPVSAILVAALVLISVPSGAYAQSANVGRASRAASPVKRTVWTIVGAAAGFGLGAWFGLHKFDDATDSDRKVWISAITGAAIGGIAGATLSRDMKPAFGRDRRPPSGGSGNKIHIADPLRAGATILFNVSQRSSMPLDQRDHLVVRDGVHGERIHVRYGFLMR